ncbi:MAG: YihY/virulence factor BrkB family protein [Thiohalobacteraceae bacterium]
MERKRSRDPRPDERGRGAQQPSDIPAPGWKDVAKRVRRSLSEHSIGLVAAGVAFYAMLSLFPALTAAVGMYGLFADESAVENQLQALSGLIPGQASELLRQQLRDLVSQSGGALTLGAVGGLLLALWSAAKGVKALFIALNIASGEDEKRSFILLNAQALATVVAGIAFTLVTLTLVLAIPVAIGILPVPDWLRTTLTLVRWPLLGIAGITMLAFLYRFGPSRSDARWRWVSWGAVGAALLWLAASAGFSWYVANLGSYNETYGSLGAVIVLLMWLYVSAYAVVLGAVLNTEMERQTAQDSTTGQPRPLGERGARAADTVGPSAAELKRDKGRTARRAG